MFSLVCGEQGDAMSVFEGSPTLIKHGGKRSLTVAALIGFYRFAL
jgi:hypothetical protein